MKKRVFSVLLVIALLVAVGIVAAQADPEYTIAEKVELSQKQTFTIEEGAETVVAPCYHCGGDDKTWTVIRETTYDSSSYCTLSGGHYVLAGNVSGSEANRVLHLSGGTSCLHLNGHNVTNTYKNGGTGAPAIRVWAGKLNLMGTGTVQSVGQPFGAILINQDTNIYGGTFKNGDNSVRAAIVGYKGTTNIYGGEIEQGSFNLIPSGGDLNVNIHGGDFSKATLTVDAGAADLTVSGGKVGTLKAANDVTINGGTVASLVGTANSESIVISGNPVINAMDLSASPVKLTFGAMTEGASINFGSMTGVISTPYNTPEEAQAVAKTIPVPGGMGITVNDAKELVLGAKTYTDAEKAELSQKQTFDKNAATVSAWCYHCGSTQTWTALSQGDGTRQMLQGGHYFLAGDITGGDVNAKWDIRGGTNCLHLNGFDVKNTANGPAIRVWSGNLNLMGEGELTPNSGVGAIYANYGTTNIYGGTIAGLYVGTSATRVAIYGAPVINAVTLSGSTKLTIGTLTQGASINIGSTQGVFTTAFDSPEAAQAASSFFSAAEPYQITVATGNVLTSNAPATKNDPQALMEYANKMSFTGNEAVEKWCPHCEKTVTWQPFNNDFEGYIANYMRNEHFFVQQDVVTERAMKVIGGGYEAVVHLNGKTISNNDLPAANVLEGSTLVVLGNGTVTTTYNGTVIGPGSVKIYGGTYANESTASGVNSVFQRTGASNMEFYAGTINQPTAGNGFGIYMGGTTNATISGGTVNGKIIMEAASGSFTLEGGKLANATTLLGTINLNGGTISNALVSTGATANGNTVLNVGGVTLEGNVTFNDNSEGNAIWVITEDFTGTMFRNVPAVENEEGGLYGKVALNITAPEGLNGKIYAGNYGLVYDTTANNGTLVFARTAIVNGETVSWYEDNAKAVAAYDGNGYIKLYVNDTVLDLGNKNVTVDVNGKNVDVDGTGTFTGFDSYTKGYFGRQPGVVVALNGSNITFAAPQTTTAEDKTVGGYLPVTNDNGETTFAYFEMRLQGVSLRADKKQVGLYYRARWSFNVNLPEAKVEAGVIVNAVNKDDITENFQNVPANGYSKLDAKSIKNGVDEISVVINGIMQADAELEAQNNEWAAIKVHAAAYVSVNGQNIITEVKSLSVRDVLELFEKPENEEFFLANEQKLGGFYQFWKDYSDLENWGLTKISNIQVAA